MFLLLPLLLVWLLFCVAPPVLLSHLPGHCYCLFAMGAIVVVVPGVDATVVSFLDVLVVGAVAVVFLNVVMVVFPLWLVLVL